ncbi:MAG: hypothetical protein NC043_07350 [Muribaculaceae bacterium]|nr:hypothetical protein [Muribaculaceae bacterium]
MKRLIITSVIAAIGAVSALAAPTLPVSFMDGPITYDAAGRITSITSLSGLPVAKFLYDPGTGPDGTQYSGIATLALDASGVPAMVNVYFVLDNAGLMTAFYFENPDDDTCCGMTTLEYTADGYLCKATNNTDASCPGRILTIRYSEPIEGQRRMLYMVNTSSVGCPGGYFTVTPSSYPDNAGINPALAAACQYTGFLLLHRSLPWPDS